MTSSNFLTAPDDGRWDLDAEIEDEPADIPPEVSGAFLTWSPSTNHAVSFDDVIQGGSDTCSFTATLSALARTDFSLASGVQAEPQLPNGDFPFQVRIFERNDDGRVHPIWVPVVFSGSLRDSDLQTRDGIEYWPAIYLRAYLQYQEDVGGEYRAIEQAFESLAGVSTDYFIPSDDWFADALQVATALNHGSPVVAGTRDDAPRLMEREYGLVHNHAYTVLGVDIPTREAEDIFVTLRNPWGVDTQSSFFDTNSDGRLSRAEAARRELGVDGNNDGMLRIPWSVFAENFDHFGIADIRGESINIPMPAEQPYFLESNIGPFTISEGQRLGPMRLTAVHPAGDALFYSLKDDDLGYIQLQSGEYSWEPPSNSSGVHQVTVVAASDPYNSVALTFEVFVLSGAPEIESFIATPNEITDSGLDRVKLTVDVVGHDVDFVEFWRDTNGNGSIDSDFDVWLGRDQIESDGWTFEGRLGGVTVGTVHVMARAGRYSFNDVHLSRTVQASIRVKPAPIVPSVAFPLTDSLIVSSTATRTHEVGKKLGRVQQDQDGNLQVFYWKSPPDRIFMQRYTNAGVKFGGPIQFPNRPSSVHRPWDAALLPDGGFAVAYWNDDGLFIQRHNGSFFESPTRLTVPPDTVNPFIRIATDAEGNALIAYNVGPYAKEDVYALSVDAANQVTRAPWRVNSEDVGVFAKWPSIALRGDGSGVIAWAEDHGFGENSIAVARTVSRYGRDASAPFAIAMALPNIEIPNVFASVNSLGEAAISYQENGLRYSGRRLEANGELSESFETVGGQVALSDSGYLISIGELDIDPDNSRGIYAQVIDPSNNPAGPMISIPQITNGWQNKGSVVVDTDGDFTVTWEHDLGTRIYARQFGINLPPEFTPATEAMRVDENRPIGTLVGMVHADDLDGDSVRYSLVGDLPFAIDPASGEIRVDGELDFESVPQYVVTIAAEDQQFPNLARQTSRTIQVNDVNDVPEIESAVFELSEDSSNGSVVGRVPAFDQDLNSRLSFLLIGDSPFAIDPSTGLITLQNAAQLDADRQSTYSLSVIVADNHAPPATASAVVSVNILPAEDETSEPPAITGLPASLTHNASAPIPIAPKVLISDSDATALSDGLVKVSAVPAAATDQIGIAVRNGVAVVGRNVRVDGILVGNIVESGRNGAPLTVIFNSNATLSRAERLLRNIEYQSNVPLVSQKNLDIEIDDGSGGRTAETITVSATEPIIGDFNQDATLDAVDLELIAIAIRQHRDDPVFDLDFSGVVDSLDHRFWVTDMKRTWLGDANLDGVFDSSDLVAIFQSNKFEKNTDAVWAEGDWNGDGRFSTADLVAAFQDGGYEGGRRE